MIYLNVFIGILVTLLFSCSFRNVIWPLQGIRMFIYFRLSVWFGVAGLGPAQPYRQSSVSPVYLRVKVGNMVNIWSMPNTHVITLTIYHNKNYLLLQHWLFFNF